MEYTVDSIYGSYVQQNNKTNGRNWYRNDARAIWWDGVDKWWIGQTKWVDDNDGGYAYLKKDGSCLPKISDTNWELWNGKSWDDAGKNYLKIRCGFRPTPGRCASSYLEMILQF